MKIVQLISSSQPYGAEKVVLDLCRELKDPDCNVFLLNLANGAGGEDMLVAAARGIGIEALSVPCPGRLDLKAVRSVRDFVEDAKIDVIHSHGYKADFYASLVRRTARVKLIATCHNWPGESLTMQFYKWLDLRALKKFDTIAVVSEMLRRDLAEWGVPEDKIVRIHNGVRLTGYGEGTDEVRKELFAEWGIGSDDRIIGTVGRLSQEKGHKYLLRAMQDLAWTMPGVKAVIAGDGPLRSQLEAQARDMKLDSVVRFLGRREDIGALLGTFDVFVLPSLKEGMPVALLEAMAARVPVVATRIGEIPHIIDDRNNGILVDKQDPDSLAQACRWLLQDRDRSKAMADRAAKKIETRFSRKIMAGNYRREYERLLSPKGAA